MSPSENARSGNALIGDCPCCGYKNALSVTEKNGRELYHCHAGCDQADLWAVVRGTEIPHYHQHAERKPANTDLHCYTQQLWQSSFPAKGTLIEQYLDARGITNIPASLRFLPHHRHTPTGVYYPVMLAAVTDHAGKLQALHRTYITVEGKKIPVEPAKMTLGAVSGYAAHLAEADKTLAVTEGIENGLSVMQATSIPTWAALSAGGITRLILPPLPLASDIIIAADYDANGVGQGVADVAAERWLAEGRRVRIAMPSTPDSDFNDMLREGAI